MGKLLGLFLILTGSFLLHISPALAQKNTSNKVATDPVLEDLTLSAMDLDGRFNFRDYTLSLTHLANSGALSQPQNGQYMRHFRAVKDVRFAGMPLFSISVERNSNSDAGAALLFEGRLVGDLKPKGMRILTLVANADVKPAVISSQLRIPDNLASRCQLSGWDSEDIHAVMDAKKYVGDYIPSSEIFGRLVFVTCDNRMASDPKFNRHANLQTLPSIAAYVKNSSVSDSLLLRDIARTRVGSFESRKILNDLGGALTKLDFPETMEGYKSNDDSFQSTGFMSGQLMFFFGKIDEPWTLIVLRDGSAISNKVNLEFPQDLDVCKETALASSQTDSNLIKARTTLAVKSRELIRYAYAITCRPNGKN